MERMYTKTIDDPPGDYTVVSRSAPLKPTNQRVWARVANCNSLADAEAAIQRDKDFMRETFGGLIEATPTEGREYAIWKATWERVV